MQENVQITMINDQATVTSNQIAEHFNKRHDHVLRAIDSLECSDEFRLLNFGETVAERENPSGGAPIQSRNFTLTRDGFAFLCMGFTGKDAAQWKERYIAAFNAMEKEIQRLYVENLTLKQQQLGNCHVAIRGLQDDNGVERIKARALVRVEEKKLARLDKQVELERLRHDRAVLEANNANKVKPEQVKQLKKDVEMWRKSYVEIELRLSALEDLCQISRQDNVQLLRGWKLIRG